MTDDFSPRRSCSRRESKSHAPHPTPAPTRTIRTSESPRSTNDDRDDIEIPDLSDAGHAGRLHPPEGEAEWVDSWADGLELLPPVDTFVLGGGMFPQYEQFWAAILDDPSAASDMLGREPYPREVTYARVAMETPHLVLSNTLNDPTWPSARIIHDIDEIRTLRQQPGKAVYVVGGPGLVTSLINAGLLDELHLIVHPVATGGGTDVFGDLAERQAWSSCRPSPWPPDVSTSPTASERRRRRPPNRCARCGCHADRACSAVVGSQP